MSNANSVYRAKKAASLSNPTSATTFVTSDSSSKAAAVYFPVFSQAAAPPVIAFRVRALGHATTVGSHNVTPKISYGVSTTAGSNTIIAAATARAVATTTATWEIVADLMWDNVSQVLQGSFWAMNGSTNVLDSPAVLTSSVTGVDFSTVGLGLSVEITIATGGGDTGFLDDFSLEVL